MSKELVIECDYDGEDAIVTLATLDDGRVSIMTKLNQDDEQEAEVLLSTYSVALLADYINTHIETLARKGNK